MNATVHYDVHRNLYANAHWNIHSNVHCQGRHLQDRMRNVSPRDVRTVSPDKLDEIGDRLTGTGAKLNPEKKYPGDWYDLSVGKGGFGIRDSRNDGKTIDINIPGVPDVTKIHQR